jgi:hypothetical protein
VFEEVFPDGEDPADCLELARRMDGAERARLFPLDGD